MKCPVCKKELKLEKKRYVISGEYVHRECYFEELGKAHEEFIDTKAIWSKNGKKKGN